MGYYVIFNYIPFGGIRIKKLKPPQTNRKDNTMDKTNLEMIKGLTEGSTSLLEIIKMQN